MIEPHQPHWEATVRSSESSFPQKQVDHKYSIPDTPTYSPNPMAIAPIDRTYSPTKHTSAKKTARRKQERLLWLHHSAGCKKDDCHCANGRRLWAHMEKCSDDNCQMKHCFSSRCLLSHFARCENAQCPVCPSVRKAIKKKEAMQTDNNKKETIQPDTRQRGKFSFSRPRRDP